MCGILGIAWRESPRQTWRWDAALECMAYRGPDGRGSYLCADGPGRLVREAGEIAAAAAGGSGVAFGHVRLAVNDLTDRSSQPMLRDGLALVYNGEIYNYRELRTELEALGQRFVSAGDTEVILAAYQQWGKDCLSRLRGMFAFAIHDTARREIFLARDRFGIKPLVYTQAPGCFAFASEPKALSELLGAAAEPDDRSVYHFLANSLYSFDEHTFYRDIRQLKPGQLAVVELPGLAATIRTYYDLAEVDRGTDPLPDSPGTISAFRDVFDESIRLHMRSDVPLGACLSGGLDSSSIVATVAANHIGTARDQVPTLKTFSAVFTDREADERIYVEKIIRLPGVAGYKVTPDFEPLLARLPELCHLHDGPLQGASVLVQNSVMQLAREHGVTVLLDGQGSDEALGGYIKFILLYALGLIKRGNPRGLLVLSQALLMGDPKIKHRLLPWLMKRSREQDSPIRKALNRSRFSPFQDEPHPAPYKTDVQQLRWQDLQVHALPAYCQNEDRNSMAYSLESRVPLLDHVFVEFALRLKPEMLFRGGLAKYVLRKAMAGRLPHEILWRRSKLGFAAPESRWLGQMTYEQFRRQLKAPERIASYFEPAPTAFSPELWAALDSRDRFHLLALDAWLSTL